MFFAADDDDVKIWKCTTKQPKFVDQTYNKLDYREQFSTKKNVDYISCIEAQQNFNMIKSSSNTYLESFRKTAGINGTYDDIQKQYQDALHAQVKHNYLP